MSDPRAQAAAQMRANERAVQPYRDKAWTLRDLYVKGAIEADEFEERLDALLKVDPRALDREELDVPYRRVMPYTYKPVDPGDAIAAIVAFQRYAAMHPMSPTQKAAAFRALHRQHMRRATS